MRFKSLDAFRGIAAVMVVLSHSTFYASQSTLRIVENAGVFVDFFFVLSGFIIAYMYQQEVGKQVTFPVFFRRRFARLYPLHLFVLLVWVPYIGLKYFLYHKGMSGTDPAQAQNAYSFVKNLLMVHAMGHPYSPSWNSPSWSISVEFFTYFVYYFVVRIFTARLSIIVFGLLVIFAFFAPPEWFLGRLFLRCIVGFFLGAMVFCIYDKYRPRIANGVGTWAAVSMLEVGLITAAIFSIPLSMHHPDAQQYMVLTYLIFMLIVYVFSVQDIGVISFVLKQKPFQLIGLLSYSIYMVHRLIVAVSGNVLQYGLGFEPVKFGRIAKAFILDWAVLANVALLAGVILVSLFTYHYIEKPWRDKLR